jgi:hypothetical protein
MKQIERTGVRGVRQFFEEKLGGFFMEQTQSDWGIDAHVEVADEEKPLGSCLVCRLNQELLISRRAETIMFSTEGCGI